MMILNPIALRLRAGQAVASRFTANDHSSKPLIG